MEMALVGRGDMLSWLMVAVVMMLVQGLLRMRGVIYVQLAKEFVRNITLVVDTINGFIL